MLDIREDTLYQIHLVRKEHSPVAQLTEQVAVNHPVDSSSLSREANTNKACTKTHRLFLLRKRTALSCCAVLS